MSYEQAIIMFLVLDGPIAGALFLIWRKLRRV